MRYIVFTDKITVTRNKRAAGDKTESYGRIMRHIGFADKTNAYDKASPGGKLARYATDEGRTRSVRESAKQNLK